MPSSAAAGRRRSTPYTHRARRTTVPAWHASADPPKRPEWRGWGFLPRSPPPSPPRRGPAERGREGAESYLPLPLENTHLSAAPPRPPPTPPSFAAPPPPPH